MNNPIDYWYQKYLKEKQTKKDLALTWRDIMAICQHFVDVNYEYNYHSVQEKYEEILRRFNEYKSKKNESERV